MRVSEFEQAVFDTEDIVIRIRAPLGEEVDNYEYERQASGGTSVTNWLYTRIYPRMRGYEVSIVDGNGQTPHGRTKLETLRASYER